MITERYRIIDGEIVDADIANSSPLTLEEVCKLLNQLDEFRLHHKQMRKKAERKNELMEEFLYGIEAYLKLKYGGER